MALFTAVAFLVGAPGVAGAAPNTPPNEGGSKTLRAKLEAAAKGHIEAKAKLANSKKRQLELGVELKRLEQRLAALNVQMAAVADKSYRLGRVSAFAVLLNSASPDAFIERAAGLETLAQRDGRQLRELTETRQQARRAKTAIDNEVREQQKQEKVMARKKRDAEIALASVGGGAAGGFINPNSPLAKPAPRNSDGSWPNESCTIDDPTTSGCLTPRTLHALKQAQANGFNHHVSCFRSGGGGEHPKGRACDFAAAQGGFEDVAASGSDKTYGDNLASFYIKNADRLGVMYVIWYRQIWMPGTGWRSYSGGGSPAGDHTNHVHLSMV
ncbi:coiled-coil domain-containing protein [Micromonospora pattaloongensis]|uniref:coiled-coil domain-containing protein n=1 Tax=Micromonospora pattaloongensis TaxID=405436 RepID=UPI003CCBCBA1